MTRFLHSFIVALLLVCLVTGTALAAVYIYKASFGTSVTLVAGTPGLSVTPTTLNFGELAIGE